MGRHQSHIIVLTKDERELLEQNTVSGSWTPREVVRAKILLLADHGGPNPLPDEEIVALLGCSKSAVAFRRKRFAETRSVEDTIFDKARSGRPTIIDGAVDAHITTLACSTPLEGQARWTLRLTQDRLITLEIIDDISHSTVGRALKKEIKPWLNKEWKIAPGEDAAFVCQMERILDVYQRAYDRNHPVVCFDETNKQHIKEVMEVLPVKEGHPRKEDSEYIRAGTSNIFMFFEPLAGFRHVTVTDRRTAVDFADAMKVLVDDLYPSADQITVVLDNLNTHTKASLYKAFSPREAKRIADRLIFEFTPKRGSWLNMAESGVTQT
ncbi:Uncharacterized protein SCG7086_AA_00690 [Chlamydiales bacterium SCGC AG-110-P3]|nr:Uncharacterized protein SCG7086_AA_00690 [Chlamydiales bacterium SCGC AG-110-P3]